jgi:hypothetical protein
VLTRSDYWIGIWPETGATASTAAFFLSLLASGATAWAVARDRFSGVAELSHHSSHWPVTLNLCKFVGIYFWITLAFAGTCATAAVITIRSGAHPGIEFFWKYVCVGVVCLTLSTLWGWLLGLFFSPVIAGLSAAFSWFIIVSTIGNAADFAPISGPAWIDVRLDSILLRVTAMSLLAVAVLARSTGETRRVRLFGRNLALGAALCLVTVVSLQNPLLEQRPPVANPVCVQGEIRYCLWPENEKYASLIREVDAQVTRLPAGFEIPPEIYDYSLSGGTQIRDGVVFTLPADEAAPEFDISEGSRWSLARGVAMAVADRTFMYCEPTTPGDPDPRRDQLQAYVESRLAGGGAPDYTTDAPSELLDAWQAGYDAAATLSDADQQVWVLEVVSGYKSDHCFG